MRGSVPGTGVGLQAPGARMSRPVSAICVCMSVSVCMDLCGWLCAYVYLYCVCVCVPIGDTHSALLAGGPSEREMQQPHHYGAIGFSNPK